jgi:hypothetical protein
MTLSIENCNELIPDERRRVLSSEARKFAESGFPVRTRFKRGETYWDGLLKAHERLFWIDAYRRRVARIARMKGKT